MSKKALIKIVAVVVCFAFIGLTLPGMVDAKPKVKKINITKILKKPASFISSLLGIVPIYGNGKYIAKDDVLSGNNGKRIKTTGGLPSHRLSDGD